MSTATIFERWHEEMKKQTAIREKNIQMIKNAKPLDEDQLRKMDSSLKKVTAFTKKLKTIGSQSVPQLLPELNKLNLSKYLDEIAANIGEAKLKTSDLEALVKFCAKLSCLYREFPGHLVAQFRKQMPSKKSDQIENASKLRVDLRFFAELLLNGLFEKEGLQLMGAVLAYLMQTDKQEHVNVSLLLPFCRSALFPITGIVPLSLTNQLGADQQQFAKEELLSPIFNDDQRAVVAKLLNDYWDSLMAHANDTRVQMNKLRKSIKRQERTRGDASADERQRFDAAKLFFERLLQSAQELSECLGRPVPEMPEEPSDDEREEAAARRLGAELSEGRVQLWPDRYSQLFYESLVDATPYTPVGENVVAAQQQAEKSSATVTSTEQQQRVEQPINESIDNVDLSCLEQQQPDGEEERADGGTSEHEEMDGGEEEPDQTAEQQDALRQRHSSSPMPMQFPTDGQQQMATANLHELLERLPNCINRDLIDAAAVEFLKHYARTKAHRKRLVQHFLQAPVDRLELLPFYARFIATIRPAYPDMAMQILQELLKRFHTVSQKNSDELSKKEAEAQKALTRTDAKIHLCTFLAELCKFGILPKAEALTCLRQLLVNMRGQKVDMLCVMIESMGTLLYRSPDAHAKMSVIMQVMRDKSTNVQDARQKILLENAYFAVIPPDEQTLASAQQAQPRLPPVYEFVQHQLATEIRVSIFRRLNWDDPDLAEFTLRLLSNSQRVHFDDLARLASLVSALADHHDWIGVRVLDDVLEFIRLSLEMNTARLQQRTFSSVAYLGQLFNYNVCNTTTLFKALYQLITFGISPAFDGAPPDHLVVRLQRIRLVVQLVDTVCEFFGSGKSKRRMDHFLYFFFRFYHETREAWSEYVETLEEFPEDMEFAVEDLVGTWRKDEQFPRNLPEAQEKVTEVEQFYKAKVEEVLAGMRSAAAERNEVDEDGKRRLNLIMEEDEEGGTDDEEADDEEEEEDEDEEEDDDEDDEDHPQMKSEDTMVEVEDRDGEEQIRMKQKQQQLLPEDEDFMHDFDRIMAESLQTAPATLQGPMTDLAVPPLVRQKFERKLKFADSESTSLDAKSGDGLLPAGRSSSPLTQTTQPQQAPNRMALMLRGGAKSGGGGGAMAKSGGVQLKAVHIAETENLHEKWRQAQEQREQDRREMKKVTLAMNERMTAEADADYQQHQMVAMANKFQFQTHQSGGGEPQ